MADSLEQAAVKALEAMTDALECAGRAAGHGHVATSFIGMAQQQLPAIRSALHQEARPFWHAVVSKECHVINKAIRRADVADEYAQKCRNEGYTGIEVIPLYTSPPIEADAAFEAGLEAAAAGCDLYAKQYEDMILTEELSDPGRWEAVADAAKACAAAIRAMKETKS